MCANPADEFCRFRIRYGRPFEQLQADTRQSSVIHATHVRVSAAVLDMALRTGTDIRVECGRLPLQQGRLGGMAANAFLIHGAFVRCVARLAVRLQRRMSNRQGAWTRVTLPGGWLRMAAKQERRRNDSAH
jgi:hypothetical protein